MISLSKIAIAPLQLLLALLNYSDWYLQIS